MKISAATFSFARCFADSTMDIATCIRTCAEMGLDAIELNDGYIAAEEMSLAEIRVLAAECGLAISAVASETQAYQPTLSGVQEHVESCLKWGQMCAELGAPIWRVNTAQPTNGMHQVTQAGATEDLVCERAIAGFRALATAGQKWGLQLAMENHFGLTRTSEDTLRFIQCVGAPNMGVNIDTGNFWDDCERVRQTLAAGGNITEVPLIEDPYEGMERLAPSMIFSHCKIYKLASDGSNDEVLDYARILRIFASAGFDGYLSIENFTLEDPLDIIPRAAEMLRRQAARMAC